MNVLIMNFTIDWFISIQIYYYCYCIIIFVIYTNIIYLFIIYFISYIQDYYTKRARGFAFVEFYDGRDAADASHHLERYIVDGREISIVFAKDRRKTSDEMRTGTAGSRSGGGRGDSYDRSAGR